MDDEVQAPSGGAVAGSHYGPYIDRQLAGEQARKESVEQRALAVITTSGVLAALLAGFLTLGGKGNLQIGEPAQAFLIASGVGFLVAAVAGLLTNVPRDYLDVGVEWLRSLTSDPVWHGTDLSLGHQRLAEAQIGVLAAARDVNRSKVITLTVALASEVIAVIALAVAVVLTLWPAAGTVRFQ